jgi:hypothetical protein
MQPVGGSCACSPRLDRLERIFVILITLRKELPWQFFTDLIGKLGFSLDKNSQTMVLLTPELEGGLLQLMYADNLLGRAMILHYSEVVLAYRVVAVQVLAQLVQWRTIGRPYWRRSSKLLY